jgi:hypothetical protein
MKRCSRCKETKSLAEFNKNRAARDGYTNECRSCTKFRYQANAEKVKARSAAYRAADPERARQQAAKWRAANKLKKRAASKKVVFE